MQFQAMMLIPPVIEWFQTPAHALLGSIIHQLLGSSLLGSQPS